MPALPVAAAELGATVSESYLADDFTDRGCARAEMKSSYAPLAGYGSSMAAQIDTYLGDDFARRQVAAAAVSTSYQPLLGYAAPGVKR